MDYLLFRLLSSALRGSSASSRIRLPTRLPRCPGLCKSHVFSCIGRCAGLGADIRCEEGLTPTS